MTEHVLDIYAPLSHIPIVGDGSTPGGSRWTGPSWVPPSERRRLSAYLVRRALMLNVRRWFLAPREGFNPDEHREYGDPQLAVDRLVAGILGTNWAVVVDGADDDLDEGPDVPDRPDDPGPDADDLDRQVHAARVAQWETRRQAAVDAWLDQFTRQPDLQARQDALREWADRQRLTAKLPRFEAAACGIGDGVMVLWPGGPGEWPRLEVMEPDGFFPVDDPDIDEDFPLTVHLAWELERTVNGRQVRFVRRITFELVDLVVDDPDGDDGVLPGERGMPWHAEGDKPATRTCLLSDGEWPLDRLGADATALDRSNAVWRTLPDGTALDRFDLGCDFLPLVHRPGIGHDGTLFGGAITDASAQILDDVAASDTDVMHASGYLADPTIALAGREPGDMTAEPGQIFGVGEKGSMDVLDMSQGHQQLVVHSDRLQDRAWTSLRVPGEVVGRVDSTDVASGVALALAFGPFGQAVVDQRTVAAPKHELILRMAQRLAQLSGALPSGPTPTARITYGPYLPTDRSAMVTDVTTLLQAGAISTHTAVAMLVAAGVPVDDATVEVERIRADDTGGAKDVADATGSEQLAAERLGLDLPGAVPADLIRRPPGAPDPDDPDGGE